MEQASAVREIAQELNDGDRNGRSTRLARLMGSSVASIRSWGAAGESDQRKRAMSPTARRLLFMLLALKRSGHDVEALRSAAHRLEQDYLGEED